MTGLLLLTEVSVLASVTARESGVGATALLHNRSRKSTNSREHVPSTCEGKAAATMTVAKAVTTTTATKTTTTTTTTTTTAAAATTTTYTEIHG